MVRLLELGDRPMSRLPPTENNKHRKADKDLRLENISNPPPNIQAIRNNTPSKLSGHVDRPLNVLNQSCKPKEGYGNSQY